MALVSNGVKPAPKTVVSWFEFLFDTTGEVLKKHLEAKNTEPSATQLIIQFLERSGLANNNVSAASETPSSFKQRLCYLALRVATHLQWNLEILEDSLSLQWQNLLLGELMKTTPLNGVTQSEIDISSLDQKTATALIVYYRWVIRTLSQHFLPNVVKSNNNGVTAENFANENILRKLQEQLPTALHILNQALKVSDDMTLPTAPSLSESKKKQLSEEENTSNNGTLVTDSSSQSMDIDSIDKEEVEHKADTKNASDVSSNGASVGKHDDVCTDVEDVKVKKDDIIAQVSFDLGTLYFYQEKFQQAMKMFEGCKNAQCSQSSFYTVNEEKLWGYYMACCGLTGISPSTRCAHLEASKPSLLIRLEQCRHSGYKDIIQLLLEDNITFELPLEYREGLVAELKTPSRRLSDDDEAAISIGLDWQVLVCNIIRDVLEGRPANPGFLLSLQNCTHNQLDMIFCLCLQSVPIEEDFLAPDIKDSTRFQVLKSFVQMNPWM